MIPRRVWESRRAPSGAPIAAVTTRPLIADLDAGHGGVATTVRAVVEFAKSGKKPGTSEGLSFYDTGVDSVIRLGSRPPLR